MKALVLLELYSLAALLASSKLVNIAQCVLPSLCPLPEPQFSKVEKRFPFSYWMYLWCKYSLIADTVIRSSHAKVLSALCGRQMHTDLKSWDFYLSLLAWKIHSKLSSSRDFVMKKKNFCLSLFPLPEIGGGREVACILLPKKRASPFQ